MFALLKTVTSRIALVVTSSATALALLELMIRSFYPQPIDFYNFTLIQVENGGDMVLASESWSQPEKSKGYGPYLPSLVTHFAGVRTAINSRGWRDTEHTLKKPERVTRIMVVGDSVVFGYGVELEDSFPKVLERELNRNARGRFEVLSFGGAGGNTYSQKTVIKNNIALYRPDLVILAFNLNDVLPKSVQKQASSSEARGLLSHVVGLRKNLDRRLRGHSHLYFVLRERMKVVLRHFGIISPGMVPIGAFDIDGDYGAGAWRDTSEALLDIAGQLRQSGVGFLLAVLPVDMQMSPEIARMYRREYGFVFSDSLLLGKPQRLIADFARRHGIAHVDLLRAFQRNPADQKFFRVYGGSVDWNHPNPLGHKIIADELRKSLGFTYRPPTANPQRQLESAFRQVSAHAGNKPEVESLTAEPHEIVKEDPIDKLAVIDAPAGRARIDFEGL